MYMNFVRSLRLAAKVIELQVYLSIMPRKLHLWILIAMMFGAAIGSQAQAYDSKSRTGRSVMNEAAPMQFTRPREIPDLPNIPVANQFLSGTEYPKAAMGPAFRQTFNVKAEPRQLIEWYASTMKNYGWTIDHLNRSFVSGTSRKGNTVSIQVDGASISGCRLAIFYSSLRDE